MRSYLVLFAVSGFFKVTGQCNLIITGVLDGPLPGGFPKMIELFALEEISSLQSYGLGAANNGNGSDGIEFTFPNEPLPAGSFIYVSAESTAFTTFFGFAPDYITGSLPNSACYFNGNDAIELFFQGQVIDVMGDVDVDGTGTLWDYMDGWMYRTDYNQCNYGSFNSDLWNSSGAGALVGESDNDSANTPFPVGVYQNSPPLPIHDFVADYQINGEDIMLSLILFGTLEEEYIIIERSINGHDFEPFELINPNQLLLNLTLKQMTPYNYLNIKLIGNDGAVYKEQKLFIQRAQKQLFTCYKQANQLNLQNHTGSTITASVYLTNSQLLKAIELKPWERSQWSPTLQNQVAIVLFRDNRGNILETKKILL